MQPWFEKYPERLDAEVSALDNSGYVYREDPDERAAGRLVLYVQYPLVDEEHELKVRFPDSYPYFPFQISSSTFPDGRHKDPYHGLLCLLKDPLQNWRTSDTLAAYLQNQVATIADIHKHPEGAGDREAQEAAQATGYFPYMPSSVVFVNDWTIPEEYNSGKLLLGVQNNLDPRNSILRGAVLKVQDAKRNPIASFDENLAERFPKTFSGHWVRLPAPPASADGKAILQEAIEIWPELAKPQFKGGPDVIGLLFPEEVSYRQYRENWVFVVRTKIRHGRHDVRSLQYVSRSAQVSRETIQARIPRLSPIANKRILIVGLGAIGSICAWQLARSGIGGLNLLDYDHVQLGNSPRWLLGWPAVGHLKSDVLKQQLEGHYPFCDIRRFDHHIGNTVDNGNRKLDNHILPDAMENVDLILDASAEWCVSHYISALASEYEIPYVWGTGTPGSWGGVVGRVVPNQTDGCWKCYQRHMNDGAIIQPSQENVPDIQTIGCFHPTFPGTGFDMDHISLAAVRLAIATLCSHDEDSYPDFDWDIGVVNIWDEKTQMPIAPEWGTYTLKQHPECDGHGPEE